MEEYDLEYSIPYPDNNWIQPAVPVEAYDALMEYEIDLPEEFLTPEEAGKKFGIYIYERRKERDRLHRDKEEIIEDRIESTSYRRNTAENLNRGSVDTVYRDLKESFPQEFNFEKDKTVIGVSSIPEANIGYYFEKIPRIRETDEGEEKRLASIGRMTRFFVIIKTEDSNNDLNIPADGNYYRVPVENLRINKDFWKDDPPEPIMEYEILKDPDISKHLTIKEVEHEESLNFLFTDIEFNKEFEIDGTNYRVISPLWYDTPSGIRVDRFENYGKEKFDDIMIHWRDR